MKLIITADDYGISPIIDDAIHVMIAKGVVTSVAGFANGKDSNGNFSVKKLKSLKQNFPEVSVGLHFTLTCGQAVSHRPKSLIKGRKNCFDHFKHFMFQNPNKIDLVELENELMAQIQVFEESGLIIEHFSDHVGMLTLIPETAGVYHNVVKKYNDKHALNVPVRNPILTGAYIDDGCLNKSVMSTFGRFGGLVMRNVSVNIDEMKKQLMAQQNNQLRTTDYFIEHLYKCPDIDEVNCIVNQVPNLSLNPLVDNRLEEDLVVEVVTHLAERPINYKTNPSYNRALKQLRKYKGISISYLKKKRFEEYQILKQNTSLFTALPLGPF